MAFRRSNRKQNRYGTNTHRHIVVGWWCTYITSDHCANCWTRATLGSDGAQSWTNRPCTPGGGFWSDSWDWLICRSRKVLDFLCSLNFSYEDKWWSQWSHNDLALQSDNCSTSRSNQLSRNLEQTDRPSKEQQGELRLMRAAQTCERRAKQTKRSRDHKITPTICLAGPPLLRQGAGKQVDHT